MSATEGRTRNEGMPDANASRPDPNAQIALMLCESLMHVLVEERVLSRHKVIDAIQTVAEVARETSAIDNEPAASCTATALLERIAQTFAWKD